MGFLEIGKLTDDGFEFKKFEDLSEEERDALWLDVTLAELGAETVEVILEDEDEKSV